MIILKVNGVPYDNFISLNCTVRLDVLCNTFGGLMARDLNEPLPFRIGDKCEIEVDGTKVFTGTIELMTINYDEDSHTIELSGRDNTSDILDSSIDELSDIREGAPFKSIIEQVIKHIGSSVQVVEEFVAAPFNPINDIAAPEPGENAFEFLEKLSRQRQVLLTSDGDGNVVITRSSGQSQTSTKLQNILPGESNSFNNNILKSNVSYDNTGRYNLYRLTGQGNPSALGDTGAPDLDPVITRGGGVRDPEIRPGRQLVISAESAFTNDDNFNRAAWEANIRKARGRLYSPTVEGFSADGDLWRINRIISVVDVFAGIEDRMLINATTFKFNLEEGQTTELTLVEPDAYTLELEEPVSGDGFF